MMLLMNDPLPEAEGGGGTTFLPESLSDPEANLLMSRDKSEEGGGGTTDGDGRVTLEFRALARSGADTGGGITAAFMLCNGAVVMWRVTAPGAGGITLADSPGPVRTWFCEMFGEGAITRALNEGAATLRSRVTLGAGGITTGAKAGATRE